MRGGIVTDAITRILADCADPQTLNAASDPDWQAPLWATLEDNGLTRAWVGEDLGGAGLSLAEGFEIVAVAGRFAVPVALVETMLAAWLLARGGVCVPSGMLTVAPVRPQDRIVCDGEGRLTGIARHVPFAPVAGGLAVIAEGHDGATVIALVDLADCTLHLRPSLSGDPCADVRLDAVRPLACANAPALFDRAAFDLMGCVVRSVQIAGGLQSVLDQSVTYANDRVAFGKSIGRFQAVQNMLARLAGEVAAAETAAGSASDAVLVPDPWDDGVFLEVAAAKIRCADAVGTGSAIAHQVHGAIGLTQEHTLHRFTLRLQDWREDFGNESRWAVVLGERIAAYGGKALWPLIASR